MAKGSKLNDGLFAAMCTANLLITKVNAAESSCRAFSSRSVAKNVRERCKIMKMFQRPPNIDEI